MAPWEPQADEPSAKQRDATRSHQEPCAVETRAQTRAHEQLEDMNDCKNRTHESMTFSQVESCTKMELMNESFISSKRDKKTVHNLQLLATVMATRLQPKAYTSRAAARSATYAAPKMPASLPSEATSIAVARLAGNARAAYFFRRESRNISAEADAPPPST